MSSSEILLSSLVLPFTEEQIRRAIRVNGGTPFHLFSQDAIEHNAQKLQDAFEEQGLPFKNYFAVKATPNPHVLRILANQGMGMDCSSEPEIDLARMSGVTGEDIIFTSNNTTEEEFYYAKEAGAIINLDGVSHIEKLEKVGLPEIVCCRYNPGDLKKGNSIIGESTKQKYGMRKDQIIEAYRILKKKGVKRFGLHAMMVSNERDEYKLIENARLLFQLAGEIYAETGVTFEFINLGGGIGVPYAPTDHEVDLSLFVQGVRAEYDKIFDGEKMGKPKIFMENGRRITGPAGALITTVQNIEEKHDYPFVGLDACMNANPRPAIYGAYHHITVIGKEHLPRSNNYHITGSLCENNDQFTAGVARTLPELNIGDIVAIHTTGAHAVAMGGQYNGRLRPAELLVQSDGNIVIIRRAETKDDYFRRISGYEPGKPFDGAVL